ncbi:MAG: choice-of-anchor D domain-containing protein [Solirubrobacteraceae bacterium]|nr:choice-of-anchor D domain-containing protein [Patulibacter sp.]
MRKPVMVTGSALALLLAVPVFTGTAAAACDPGDPVVTGASLTDSLFNTPGTYCYVVPDGVETLRTTLIGGRGGGYDAGQGYVGGGFGALVQARLDVVAGEALRVTVANNGPDGQGFSIPTSGGEATSVDDLLVAAGGGGSGTTQTILGGSRGGSGGSAGASATAGGSGADYNGNLTGAGGAPGTFNAIGVGGTMNGNAGGSGQGGVGPLGGAGGIGPFGAGGGGGDGYFGGGGGSGGNGNFLSGGGGGGAGSSFIDPSVDGGTISTDGSGVPMVLITAGGVGGATTSAPAGVDFAAAQPQATLSAARAITITSSGTASLRIGALTVGGNDPDDFLVSGDTCRATLKLGASCQVFVRFVPQASGPRSAQLLIDGNLRTVAVPLSGTGGALPSGATGAAGAAGAAGATGAAGAQGVAGAAGIDGAAGAAGATGAAGAVGATGLTGADGKTGLAGPTGAAGQNGTDGKDASTSCLIQTTKTKSDAAGSTTVLCTITLVAGRKAGSAAALTRNGKVYASGVEHRGQPLSLTVRGGGTLRPGTYTLRRSYRQSGRTVTERRQVTVR